MSRKARFISAAILVAVGVVLIMLSTKVGFPHEQSSFSDAAGNKANRDASSLIGVGLLLFAIAGFILVGLKSKQQNRFNGQKPIAKQVPDGAFQRDSYMGAGKVLAGVDVKPKGNDLQSVDKLDWPVRVYPSTGWRS